MTVSRAQLEWLCRRGTRELDLLLGGYLAGHYDRADARERASFLRLLELDDDRLQGYLLAAADPDEAELSALVAKIRTGIPV